MASRWKFLVPPVVLFVAFLTAWEMFVRVRDIQPYLLPKPSAVWTQIDQQRDNIWDAAFSTGSNAFVGLLCGIVSGVVMAVVASRFRVFREMVTPLAAAINAMPIIAVTPVFTNMITDGSTNTIPRRLVTTILVFFPIFVNVMRGLTQADPIHTELLHSYAASSGAMLRKVRFPNAVSFFFTGFKIAAPVSVIAAVVAEYFGGLQKGLGVSISSNAAQTRTAQAWAYVAASCALGLTFFVVSILLERLATPWRARRDAA